MNQNTCITIDVSQNKSHIQGFIGSNKPLSKARTMRHTKQGYQFILTLKDLIESKTNESPLIIFEFTGIYHKSLEKFLISQNLKYHIVAPLRAAKARSSEIREQKTDARDCLSLSKLFYTNNLGMFYSEDESYSNLRKLNRYYDTCMKHLIKIKVNFRETLAVIYPNYKKLFTSIYSDESLTFLKEFPHPSIYTSKSEDKIIETLKEKWNHLESWTSSKVKKLTPLVNEIVSGCSVTEPDIIMLLSYITQIEYYLNQIKYTVIQMNELAKKVPLYNLVHSLPGIQDILTCKFIAELGDISRFTNYKQIVAYAGIDPMIRQSGDKDGLHLKMSKKGNKRLRTILHLMVSSLIKANREPNAIKTKYQKKTHQLNPLKPKVASMACANQLVRIIFYMHKTSSTYTYQKCK
ncbi:MAG: IS110 family transposase [Bacilli bacterium]|nr:IS110 family transposase [Bacilli bacterium]